MIDITKLTEKDKGRKVVYSDGFKKEYGLIKSWNDHNVFVVYNCGGDWERYQQYTAASTNPDDLSFIRG